MGGYGGVSSASGVPFYGQQNKPQPMSYGAGAGGFQANAGSAGGGGFTYGMASKGGNLFGAASAAQPSSMFGGSQFGASSQT